MKKFNIRIEQGVDIDVESLFSETWKIIPGYLEIESIGNLILPRNVMAIFSPQNKRSYSEACDSGFLIDYLKSACNPPSLTILKTPLLGDSWGFFDRSAGKHLASMYLCLGRCDEGREHVMISVYGIGSGETLIRRSSKMLAHELAHTTGLEDDCCGDENCIMYKPELSPYIELPKEKLESLDRQSGWCDFHGSVLFPGFRNKA